MEIYSNNYCDGFFKIVKAGDLKKVKNFIYEKSVTVDMLNSKGNSALHYAFKKNHPKIVLFLQENGGHIYTKFKKYEISDEIIKCIKEFEEKVIVLPFHKEVINNHENELMVMLSYPEKYKHEALKNYFICTGPAQVMNEIQHIVSKNLKRRALELACHISLCCGDSHSAHMFADSIAVGKFEKHLTHHQLIEYNRLVSNFEVEMQNGQHDFSSIIKDGFNLFNSKHNYSPEFVKKIQEEMIFKGSFLESIKYANSLEDPTEKWFACCGLSLCHFNKIAVDAKNNAESIIEQQMLNNQYY